MSILSSLAVSLTLTPVLSYWLLAERRHGRGWPRCSRSAGVCRIGLAPRRLRLVGWAGPDDGWRAPPGGILPPPWRPPLVWWLMIRADRLSERQREGLPLRLVKGLAGRMIEQSLPRPARCSAWPWRRSWSAHRAGRLERDSSPFDEGAVQST